MTIEGQIPSRADVDAILALVGDGSIAELPVEHGSPVYFLAKDAGTWRVAAAQNTVVVPSAVDG